MGIYTMEILELLCNDMIRQIELLWAILPGSILCRFTLIEH